MLNSKLKAPNKEGLYMRECRMLIHSAWNYACRARHLQMSTVYGRRRATSSPRSHVLQMSASRPFHPSTPCRIDPCGPRMDARPRSFHRFYQLLLSSPCGWWSLSRRDHADQCQTIYRRDQNSDLCVWQSRQCLRQLAWLSKHSHPCLHSGARTPIWQLIATGELLQDDAWSPSSLSIQNGSLPF